MATEKVYCAEVVLGATTATDDAEAPLLQQQPIHGITLERLEACLAAFLGEIDQVPPAYAAVRQGGQRLYVLARKGVEVERSSRRVRIDDIALIGWEPPRLRLRVRCGAGTYIRSLARDIGSTLGVGGYLHALRRTRSGSFTLLDSVPLETLTGARDVASHTMPPDRALTHLPAAVLSPADLHAVRNGRPVALRPVAPEQDGGTFSAMNGGRLGGEAQVGPAALASGGRTQVAPTESAVAGGGAQGVRSADPVVTGEEAQAARTAPGTPLHSIPAGTALGGAHVGDVRLYGGDGGLAALGRYDGTVVRPFRVFGGDGQVRGGVPGRSPAETGPESSRETWNECE
jgi:tRNA pseudouridine(55) synthase